VFDQYLERNNIIRTWPVKRWKSVLGFRPVLLDNPLAQVDKLQLKRGFAA
jgi:hypothetical protein